MNRTRWLRLRGALVGAIMVVGGSVAVTPQASAQRVLLALPDTISAARSSCASTLTGTGRVTSVTTFTLPTFTTMLDYDVVVVAAQTNGYTASEANTIGDSLADYIDRGHGVVVLGRILASAGIGGRMVSAGYLPYSSFGGFTYVQNSGPYVPDIAAMPNSPLLANTVRAQLGAGSFTALAINIPAGNLRAGTIVPEWWPAAINAPLVMARPAGPFNAQVVAMNMPCSPDPHYMGSWNSATSTSVPTLFANAVHYALGPDFDADGRADRFDNCPHTKNGTQADVDGDGRGDACDTRNDLDVDADGASNTTDNCPFDANVAQTDTDADGLGDACDDTNGNDVDADTIANTLDVCPFVADAAQTDTDGDGLGDACDDANGSDVDGDGVANTTDICPFHANAGQADADGDGIGDACDTRNDLDLDDDGVANTTDVCPFVADVTQGDADADGLGDACDAADGNDLDGDGVLNVSDNCPFVVNLSQLDGDGDLIGDVCDGASGVVDTDADDDGVANGMDNCAFGPNPAQADVDGDGLGDDCDPLDGRDVDQDGTVNVEDNCPFVANPSQSDVDADGLGDGCDDFANAPSEGCAVSVTGRAGMPLGIAIGLLLLAMRRRTRA